MRLHRFFLDQKLCPNSKVKIESDELVHQWRHVLRFQVGQELILFDNSGLEFQAIIVSIDNRSASVEITANRPGSFAPRLPVFLFLALAKRDSFEWTLEKCTELGVAGFVPVISERSEKKNLNLERCKKIVTEASEQSNRTILPEISEPEPLAAVLEKITATRAAGQKSLTIVLDPTGEPFDLAKYLPQKEIKNPDVAGALNIFIGPEGGFSQKEIALFAAAGLPIVSLGGQVLRAETAAVAISSILLLA